MIHIQWTGSRPKKFPFLTVREKLVRPPFRRGQYTLLWVSRRVFRTDPFHSSEDRTPPSR